MEPWQKEMAREPHDLHLHASEQFLESVALSPGSLPRGLKKNKRNTIAYSLRG